MLQRSPTREAGEAITAAGGAGPSLSGTSTPPVAAARPSPSAGGTEGAGSHTAPRKWRRMSVAADALPPVAGRAGASSATTRPSPRHPLPSSSNGTSAPPPAPWDATARAARHHRRCTASSATRPCPYTMPQASQVRCSTSRCPMSSTSCVSFGARDTGTEEGAEWCWVRAGARLSKSRRATLGLALLAVA